MGILNNFVSIYCFITFVIGAAFMLVTLCIAAMGKVEEPRNNVHFYVARDKNGELSLYLTKPVRHSSRFCSSIYGQVIVLEQYFENFNLKVEDFKDLKWEDEPVEVFVSIKN